MQQAGRQNGSIGRRTTRAIWRRGIVAACELFARLGLWTRVSVNFTRIRSLNRVPSTASAAIECEHANCPSDRANFGPISMDHGDDDDDDDDYAIGWFGL